MFATTQLGGKNVAMPDVCLTPVAHSVPAPVACQNYALPSMAVIAADAVLMGGAPAHHLGTTIPITMSSHPGAIAGASSGTVMGPSRNMTGASTVLCDGHPLARMGGTTLSNNMNASGATVVPSQLKVSVLAR